MKPHKKDIYILGSGLTHDGSVCLLKNGRICVAIEKERITRIKHDGENDTEAINYCLQAEGIAIHDLDLVVQNANFGFFEYGNSYFHGERLFNQTVDVPVVTISHHLAHAYYGLCSSPFDEMAIFVLDGCGNLYDECIDLEGAIVFPENIPAGLRHAYAEKDSFYLYKDNKLTSVYKDFSQFGLVLKDYPMHPTTTMHSIGGLYGSASEYCIGDGLDTGKLMGLAPYGKPGVYKDTIFELKEGRIFLNYDWMRNFMRPVRSYEEFWANFQYYADIAYWIQKETERAISYLIRSRRELVQTDNLAYTGGVALNAVANARAVNEKIFKNVHLTPAAGDNGLAIGCAYYGWLEVLKKERIIQNGSSSFGKVYTTGEIKKELTNFIPPDRHSFGIFIKIFFESLPLFINKPAITRSQYLIQFVLPDAGVFYFVINEFNAEMIDNPSRIPDCAVHMDAITFISFLKEERTVLPLLQSNQAFLTGDWGYFLQVIMVGDLMEMTGRLARQNNGFKKIHFSEEENLFAATATLLSEGKVIGWFQDGCEFGPRALGHRSILADPRKKGIRKFINNKVKFREDFRPFAPSVLKEYVSDYFKFSGESPYMILVAPVKEVWKEKIAGVVHVDNSCRIQTVTRENNSKFYSLIQEFMKITGLPILLNTSFNKKGMPIVETPLQALNYFFECALDCLVIDKFLIVKEPGTYHSVGWEEKLHLASTGIGSEH